MEPTLLNLVRVGGMEEGGYSWHAVVTWLTFGNEDFHNCKVLILVE